MFPDKPCFQIIGQYFRPTKSDFGLPRLFAFKNKLPPCTLANCPKTSEIHDQDADAESQGTSRNQMAGITTLESTAASAPSAPLAPPAPPVLSSASTLTDVPLANRLEQQDTTGQVSAHSNYDHSYITKPEPTEETLLNRSTTQNNTVIDLTDDKTPDLKEVPNYLPTDHGYAYQSRRYQSFQQAQPMYNWDNYGLPIPMSEPGFGNLPNNRSEEDSYEVQIALSRLREHRAKVEEEKAMQDLLEAKRRQRNHPHPPVL